MTIKQSNTSISTPKCSVCVANYNGVDVIEDCLNSVFAQDCDFAFEVIVHDDASTDGSADFVRDHYPGAILIPSVENVGFCVSNNRMVAHARGEYILLLNNDAALLPDALAILKKEAERIGKPAILSLPQYDATTGELLDIGSLLDPFLNPVPNRNPDHNEVGMVAGACLWIPRTLWLELDGFPEWFGSIGEDLYLCCRARLTGYPVHAVGISGYRHRVGASFGGGKVQQGQLATTRRRRALSERNKTFVIILCYPSPLFQLIFPLHVALLLAEGTVLAIIKRDFSLMKLIYLGCLKALWRERTRLMFLRRGIQATRRISLCQFSSPFFLLPHKLSLLIKHGIPKIL